MKIRLLIYLLTLFWLIPLSSIAIVENQNSTHNVICGITSVNGDDVKIVKKTRTIPFVTTKDNPDYYFGCTINSEKKLHVLEAVLIAPITKKITSNIGHAADNLNKTTTVKYNPYAFTDFAFIVFQLNEGDQLGIYKLTIIIDGKPEKQITFNIVE